MNDDALFDDAEYRVAPEPQREPDEPPLSADRRRTQRQLAILAAGRHPLTRGPLHPEAAPVDDRHAAGRRCDSCQWLVAYDHHNRRYLKFRQRNELYVTHGAASDVRAWWPACTGHVPLEGA